jgi:hypothetical protein
MNRFSFREDKFPYSSSVGGLYLNHATDDKQSVQIARILSEKWLPSGDCLIELETDIPQAKQIRQLGKKYVSLVQGKFEKNSKIRKVYLNKLVDMGCIDMSEISKLYHADSITEEEYLEKTVMRVPFDFNGVKKIYTNLTLNKMFYHIQLDIIIEFVCVELFVYNAKMTFLSSDFEGLEFCKLLKSVEVASPKETQDEMLHACINERLHKRITKKIGIDVDINDFQKNFDSYKAIYDMWKV